MANFTAMENATCDNDNTSSRNDPSTYYSICVGILVATALVAMIVNVMVFVSVHWIRRPMPPVLRMSISLAAADALSSPIFAGSLLIGTLFPYIGFNLSLIMEMIKLSGILITVTHLCALSLNHYIGILKPLHYNSIVTRRKVTALTVLMWIVPTLFVVCLFTTQAEEGLWSAITVIQNDNETTFIDTFRFRMSYGSCFIISIIIMAICYTHILIIVRRQQNVWKNLSRMGSTKWSGRTGKNCKNREQKQLEGNIRAFYTTLLILGTCVIGWMPAMLIYVLMCKKDCYINGEELQHINCEYLKEFMTLRLVENMLVLLKMLANPIIYSIRMKEIQDGMKHMKSALIRIFCPSRPDSRNYTRASRRSPNACNSSLRTGLTTSINNSGQTSHVSIARADLVNNTLL